MLLQQQHSQYLVNNYQPELSEAARSKDLCCFKNLPSTSQQVGSDTSEGKKVPVLQPTGLLRHP